MAIKGFRIPKILFLIFTLLIVGGFALNWFMTYRLQSKLNEHLSEEVLKATNGFYRCSFDNLSVGLFSGELSIQGVELKPDSIALEQWKKGDSLPEIYYNIHIGEIHFRGINLTWRKDYTNLHFSLFELKSPDIKVVQPVLSYVQKKEKHPNKDLRTLYEVVSPYIDELAVNRIRLSNAYVHYVVEDSVSPVIYGLKDANFRAFNFRLNKDSYDSGKLLYCDHFEFEADQPQQLLYSDQLILETQNIKLSTIESLISIEGVHIAPKESFWNDRMHNPGGYIKAEIKSVALKGVGFKRENAENYLHATSFDIASTDIQYYSVRGGSQQEEEEDKSPTDTINDQTWSLYGILSPILHSISIDKIGIEKTKFNYTLTQKGYTDVYTLYHFDFHANNFLVDSLSEQQKKFWYVDNFTLTGDNINGLMESNNSNISANSLYLSTIDSSFHISDIKVKALSSSSSKDYMSGGIKQISIEGLDYDKGVSANQLRIDSFNIDYYKVAQDVPKQSKSKGSEKPEDILDMFTPYADYLSVRNINLKDANVTFHDKAMQETYRLRHLNFYATEFLIDEQTRRASRYLFTCNDIGLSIKDFDNLLPGGYYRLQVKDADISTLTGKLKLEDVRLIPQTATWTDAPDTYYDFKTSLIDIRGFNNEAYANNKAIQVKSLKIAYPDIRIVKTGVSTGQKKDTANKGLLSRMTSLFADTINIAGAKVAFSDKMGRDSTKADLYALNLRSLDWTPHKGLDIKALILQSPVITNVSHKAGEAGQADKNQALGALGKHINIETFVITNPQLSHRQPDLKLLFKTESFNFSGLHLAKQDKSVLNLTSVNLIKPYINIDQSYQVKVDTVSDKSLNRSPYAILRPYVNEVTIKDINISDANINYNHALDKKVISHRAINKTNLSIDGLSLNTDLGEMDMDDFRFNTTDLRFPIMDGFYTLAFGRIELDKKQGRAQISGMHMIPAYPKMEFSHKHPLHKDWFDVSVGNISLLGIDYPLFFKSNILKASGLEVDKVMLRNLKNKQIYTPPKMQPMIYTKIQELPIGLDIAKANITDFSVVYEELPKGGTETGKILFSNMNGSFSKLTNMASYPEEYMRLDIDGRFMDNGHFTARWDMPISSDYDCFVLDARLKDFNLRELNQIFLPLAKAEITKGTLNDFRFITEATSMDAHADMLFLYNDLKLSILKNTETEEPNKFLTSMANIIVRSNNPNKPKSKPREANIYIERDPYHSSFNYFWQIIQPAVVESVGVSQGKQNRLKKVAGFFTKVKNFFSGKKGKEEKPQTLPE